MGLSVSILLSAWHEILRQRFLSLVYNMNISSTRMRDLNLRCGSFKKSVEGVRVENRFKNSKPENVAVLDRNLSFECYIGGEKEKVCVGSNGLIHKPLPAISLPEPAVFFSPRPVSELEAAATKLQKVYKSYRTRRNLADCAVVVEELWWKALDFAALKRSSISFFNDEKQETAVSRWARARTRVAKVGKGLSQDDKAQSLALQHWLEAIDPRHRYGHNLHLYYDVWFGSESTQPFFYWLDIGDGKEVNLEKCPRSKLQSQCIQYLGPKEREAYEVVVENGKLVYRESGNLVKSEEGSKLIFVLSTARALYIGQKKKGAFQHSSFLSGAATTAAGRLRAEEGFLKAIWPYSGHYLPTAENFKEFISFLKENNVDLTNVKKYTYDGSSSEFIAEDDETSEATAVEPTTPARIISKAAVVVDDQLTKPEAGPRGEEAFDMSRRLSCKWTSGTGPRIGCVRDYPADLQSRALEHVNLSPRVANAPQIPYPIPSPRPSPRVRLSPRLSYMGLPSPRPQVAGA